MDIAAIDVNHLGHNYSLNMEKAFIYFVMFDLLNPETRIVRISEREIQIKVHNTDKTYKGNAKAMRKLVRLAETWMSMVGIKDQHIVKVTFCLATYITPPQYAQKYVNHSFEYLLKIASEL